MDDATKRAEAMARRFHDAYEELAPSFGYVTREDTREFKPKSPNGRLMIAVCARLLAEMEPDEPAAAPDADLGGREALAHARELRARQ